MRDIWKRTRDKETDPWVYEHTPAPPAGYYSVPFIPHKGTKQVHTIVVSAKGRIRLPDHPGIGPKTLMALSRTKATTGLTCRCCEVLRYILEKTTYQPEIWGNLAPRQRRHTVRIEMESHGMTTEIYGVFRVVARRRAAHAHDISDPLVLYSTHERLLQRAAKAHMAAEQANNQLKERRIKSVKKYIKVK